MSFVFKIAETLKLCCKCIMHRYALIFFSIYLFSACQKGPDSESFPDLNLSGNVTVRVTCISHPNLCESLITKGGVIQPGKVFDSAVIKFPAKKVARLEKIQLCGFRAVTQDITFNLSDESGTTFIFTLNTDINDEGTFILGSQSLGGQGIKHAYPCTQKGGEILIDVMSSIFFE